MDTREKLEEIKKRTRDGLFISRIPIQVKKEFKALANGEEFLGDYGFALKWLMDFRNGLLSSPNQELIARIELLENELEQLKVQPKAEQEKKKVIRSVGGNVIAKRKEE